MADIFLSYSREDRSRVEPLADALVGAGYTVWWDRQLTGGKRYLEETEAELQSAKAVLVVWTKTSIASHWVADEAGAGRDTGRLVPISLDGSVPPLGFRQFQVIDFSNWPRDQGQAFKQLIGALGKTSASSDEAIAAPVLKKQDALSGLPRNPWVLGGFALAAIALVTLIATTAGGSKPAGIGDQRAAFFGFTAADASELSTQIAGVATDETFAAMTAMNLQTAARGDTLGVPLDKQLDKAAALGARYAFGGNVRTSDEKITITIRLDDSSSRATLWQGKLTGGTAERESLPVRAAAQATNLLECLIQVRPDMVREDASALALVTRACGFLDVYDRQYIDHWRDVLRVAPRSARAEVGLAGSYWFQSLIVSDAERPALLREVREAANRILAIEPNHSGARVALARFDISTDTPLQDILSRIDLAVEDWIGPREGNSASLRMLLLSAVGRNAEAVRIGLSDANASPFNSAVQLQYGMALANSGQAKDGLRVLESMNRRLAAPKTWTQLAGIAILADGDLGPIVAAAPPGVPLETIACIEDFSMALRSTTAAKAAASQRVMACVRADHFAHQVAIPVMAQLGDVEAVLAFADEIVNRTNPFAFTMSAAGLFSPDSRQVRADPRFLPLVKDVGIFQYWIDTGKRPDVCLTDEEKGYPFCVALEVELAKTSQR